DSQEQSEDTAMTAQSDDSGKDMHGVFMIYELKNPEECRQLYMREEIRCWGSDDKEIYFVSMVDDAVYHISLGLFSREHALAVREEKIARQAQQRPKQLPVI